MKSTNRVKNATAYLKKVQRIENAKQPMDLMPSFAASHISGRPTATTEALKFKPAAQAAPSPERDAGIDLTKPFSCGSIAAYGGYTYIPSFESPMGQQNSNLFNVNFDGEWGLTRNFCMGIGMGYAMTSRDDGGNGNIVPFFMRFSYKVPLDFNRRFIGWVGTEVGGALLEGFDTKSDWSSENETTAAFMAGPAAGVDIRIQNSLYMTIGASYTPIFYKNTIHMIQGRVGIRYYFW